jgi:CRP-like cAMP-binding protein
LGETLDELTRWATRRDEPTLAIGIVGDEALIKAPPRVSTDRPPFIDVRRRAASAPAPSRPGQRARSTTVDVIANAPLFSALDSEATADLRASMTEVRLTRRQVLFHEGEHGDRLYVIAEGKIKMGRTARDGRSNLLHLLGPGDTFGEPALFDPGPHTSTATAVTDARLYSLRNQTLMPWLRARPEVVLSLLGQLSRRLRRSTEMAGDLVLHDTAGRVAKLLLDLSARFGQPGREGVLVGHDLTQRELGQLAGASRETVNKVLSDFACRGWLRLTPGAVVLLDVERLQRRAR